MRTCCAPHFYCYKTRILSPSVPGNYLRMGQKSRLGQASSKIGYPTTSIYAEGRKLPLARDQAIRLKTY